MESRYQRDSQNIKLQAPVNDFFAKPEKTPNLRDSARYPPAVHPGTTDAKFPGFQKLVQQPILARAAIVAQVRSRLNAARQLSQAGPPTIVSLL